MILHIFRLSRAIKQGANYFFIGFLYKFDKLKYHTINLL